jgi:hypothetical protein
VKYVLKMFIIGYNLPSHFEIFDYFKDNTVLIDKFSTNLFMLKQRSAYEDIGSFSSIVSLSTEHNTTRQWVAN